MGRPRQDPVQRFQDKWAEADTGYETPCHFWLAVKDQEDVGEFWLDGEMRKADRVAYEMVHGPVEGELMHLCNVRECVRPEHMMVTEMVGVVNE